MKITEFVEKARQIATHTYAARAGLDLRALALFRAAFGLTLLANLFTRCYGGKLLAHYTERGLMPLAALTAEVRWSFLDAFTQPWAANVAVALIAFVYVAFTVGWRTRIMRTLIPLILISLYHRNPMLDDGSDWTLRFFALWMQFFPLGERWSVDAIYSKWPVRAESTLRSAAALAFVLNLAISYFLNAAQKDSLPWLDGTAVRLVLWDPWTSSGLAAWLRQWAPDFLIAMFTYGAKVAEYVAAALVLLAFFYHWAKLPVLVLLVGLHAGFGLNIHLGTFVLNYFAIALVFTPPRWLDWLDAKRTFSYDFSAVPSRRAVLAANAALTIFCLHQGRLLLLNNPGIPEPMKRMATQLSPAWINKVDALIMVTQEWFMFRFPGAVPLLTVETVMSDGRRLDPFRGGEFSPTRPALESQHVGKYWVTFLWRLPSELTRGMQSRFSRYFFERGAREVNLYSTNVVAPRTAAESVRVESPRRFLSMKKPNEWNFQTRDLISEGGRRDLAAVQNMLPYEGNWEQNDQLFLGFQSVSERAQLSFDSEVECLANVTLQATGGLDFGRVVVALNGQFGGTHDEFSASGVTRLTLPLGALKVAKGTNRLSITVVGKNEKSRGLNAGVDVLHWDCREE